MRFHVNPREVTKEQYELLTNMRLNQDSMMWQTPVLRLTAQAFLFVIAFGDGDKVGRLIAFILAFGTAVATAQLLLKHRYLEFYYSRLLEAVEKAKEMAPIHAQVPKARGIVGWRSHRIWLGVLVFFGLAALYGAGRLVVTCLV